MHCKILELRVLVAFAFGTVKAIAKPKKKKKKEEIKKKEQKRLRVFAALTEAETGPHMTKLE